MTDSSVDQVIVLSWGRVWELMTEHGTRIIISVHERDGGWRWMRLPAPHDDGIMNGSRTDGDWQRLFTLRSSAQATEPSNVAREMEAGFRLTLGEPVRLFTGTSNWWTTTNVMSVRELPDHEVPEDRTTRHLRRQLLRARDAGDSLWTTHATAAHIKMLREQDLSWELIDAQLTLSAGRDPLEVKVDWDRILLQDHDLVAVARSILEDEVGD